MKNVKNEKETKKIKYKDRKLSKRKSLISPARRSTIKADLLEESKRKLNQKSVDITPATSGFHEKFNFINVQPYLFHNSTINSEFEQINTKKLNDQYISCQNISNVKKKVRSEIFKKTSKCVNLLNSINSKNYTSCQKEHQNNYTKKQRGKASEVTKKQKIKFFNVTSKANRLLLIKRAISRIKQASPSSLKHLQKNKFIQNILNAKPVNKTIKKLRKMNHAMKKKNILHEIAFFTETQFFEQFDFHNVELKTLMDKHCIIKNKNLLVAAASKNKNLGIYWPTIAYSSGQIIGVAPTVERSFLCADDLYKKIVKFNRSTKAKNDERNHILKKGDTEIAIKHKRILNAAAVINIKNMTGSDDEVYMEELYEYLCTDFSYWRIIYDPEIAPFIVISKSKFQNVEESFNAGEVHYNQFSECLNKNLMMYSSSLSSKCPITTIHWPTEAERKFLRARDQDELNNWSDFEHLKCVYIISQRQIIIHRTKSENDLKLASKSIWAVVKNFIGSSTDRFSSLKHGTFSR